METGKSGVAKLVTIVPVKTTASTADFLWMFRAIHDNIRTRRDDDDLGEPGKVTVWMTWVMPLYAPANRYVYSMMQQDMLSLMNDDVVIIVPAGNVYNDDPRQAGIDVVPAAWESASFPIIVIGGSDMYGSRPYKSKYGPQIAAWSQGVNVLCAQRGTRNYIPFWGTCVGTSSCLLQSWHVCRGHGK